ncbi:muscleblind-like protein 1 isoform X2 [Antedon mediterranea]|uniref:muscleblind-like protein 1 isoform X2 n=1 Tax=Antedon mediterranea TaxID=105859 RepID=UPI003AF80962
MAVRDTAWLTLEACREYIRGTCKRPDSECKFAHPAKTVTVENGKVIACFDSLKGRCTRENCKYLHPPPHLKTQLEINGRNNLAAQKLMQSIQSHQQHQLVQMQAMSSHVPLQQTIIPAQSVTPTTQTLASDVSGSLPSSVYSHINQYTPYIYTAGTHPQMIYAPQYANNMSVGTAQVPATYPYSQFLTSPIMNTPSQPGYAEVPIQPNHPHVFHSPYPFAFSPKPKNDRLEVCREFQRGVCSRGENECKFAHPGEEVTIDSTDNTATVCMDYIKGRCSRDKCRYYHPPPHLQVRIKSAQQHITQANTALTAAATILPTTAETNRLKRTSDISEDLLMAMPPMKKGPGMTAPMVPANFMYHPQLAAAVMGPQPLVQTLSMVPHQGTLPYLTQHLVQAQQRSENNEISDLSDTMPVCRDFKSGHCKRPNCKYAHVSEEYVEVVDGKVTMCRDAGKGKCIRPSCKYYHAPSSATTTATAIE